MRAVWLSIGIIFSAALALRAQTTPATPAVTAQNHLAKAEQNLFGWIVELERSIPTKPADFQQLDLPKLVQACNSIEQWSIEITRILDPQKPDEILQQQRFLLVGKQRFDQLLDRTLNVRKQFSQAGTKQTDRTAVVNFLQCTSMLTDLSGKLRYLQRDAFDLLSSALIARPEYFTRLVDRFAEQKSAAGALVLLDLLLAAESDEALKKSMTIDVRRRICQTADNSGAVELLGDLIEVLKSTEQPAAVRWSAAQAVLAVGLPQQIRPGSDPTNPTPLITPAQFYEQLQRIPREQLSAEQQAEITAVIKQIAQRMRQGIADETFRYGRMELRDGDWLLMRNPSPYNHCTDLSPGLFTHVGIVTVEKGKDGIRRFVIADLPERGITIPATNVEVFLERTLNFAFLRHSDPAVGVRMGQAAAECIGNPCEFDLNFRTDRIQSLAGKPLTGQKIHTYCAGFLLLCGQAAESPADELFPLHEIAAPGNIRANFGQLGFSFGDRFVSPTGALFSPRMEIVGRRDPMYDPRREVEEAIFDHFAFRCRTGKLVQSPDLLQGLRTKLAEASKANPLLGQALAATANVSAEMDLVAAAKAAAVVETLDEIAFGRSAEYTSARTAILDGPQPPVVPERTPQQVQQLRELRVRHADLAARWDARKLPPRLLRIELVKYYSTAGKQDLDRRFFPNEKEAPGVPQPAGNAAAKPNTNPASVNGKPGAPTTQPKTVAPPPRRIVRP